MFFVSCMLLFFIIIIFIITIIDAYIHYVFQIKVCGFSLLSIAFGQNYEDLMGGGKKCSQYRCPNKAFNVQKRPTLLTSEGCGGGGGGMMMMNMVHLKTKESTPLFLFLDLVHHSKSV